ncbi:ZDHC4 palmitoyltransferase, partial [Upupa epops]|nr:ZDHC4 palmitoyltransferase [Upupa epops]
MDFLSLFLLYVAFVLTAVGFLCFCLGVKESFLARRASSTSQVLAGLIPTQLQRATHMLLHRLFYTRSRLFVVLHMALQAAVFGEYSWEVLGYCWELHFPLLLLLLPYLLLAGNLCCLLLCSWADPGLVTASTQAALVRVYAYDGVLFRSGGECPTCKLERPARSKHCRLCGACVQRFDHHCVWVNNCIGAFNTRFFLLYLLTLTAMAAAVSTVTAALLVRVVLLSGVMHGTYIDEQGQARAVDVPFLIQHLFLTFPRIVFMLGFLLLLTLVLGAYCCFHLYLALTNQTSNEWYQSRRLGRCCRRPRPQPGAPTNFYSRGAWMNLQEIFRPPTAPGRVKE